MNRHLPLTSVRGGIGMGHRDDFRGTDDPSGALLREWVGADAEAYL